MISLETYIEATNNATTAADVFAVFQKTLLDYGYDRICYSLITDHPSVNLKAGHGVFRNYPDDWMSHYSENGYQHIDPVPKQAFITARPFAWDSINQKRQLSPSERKVMSEAEAAGLFSGIGVPLHGISGEIAGVGLASSLKNVTHDQKTLYKLHAISAQFHLVYSEHESTVKSTKQITLTPREREVLLWASEGKSDQTIADILNLSYATVRFHMNSAFQKLEANERTLAVVKAIRLGLILPSYTFK